MNEIRKIYCAGAIRGKKVKKGYFTNIVKIINEFSENYVKSLQPLAEKGGYKSYELYPLTRFYESGQSKDDKLVAGRDRKWIKESDAVIAEISGPSTGTGWEICYATRVNRKPTLCLYDSSVLPSLMIKQDIIDEDSSKYTIIQEYQNEEDFEMYVKTFLEAIIKKKNIDDIKYYYNDLIHIRHKAEAQSIFTEKSQKETIQAKLSGVAYVYSPEKQPFDFKDAKYNINFLIKTLILQKRWDHLRSQELGSSFIAGKKVNIIKVFAGVSDDTITNLFEVYRKKNIDRIYTWEAFAKSIRAFRRIGLFENLRTTKNLEAQFGIWFKDKAITIKEFNGDLTTVSMRSPRDVNRNKLFIMTSYLQALSFFLDKFGNDWLMEYIKRKKRTDWYANLNVFLIENIDDINDVFFLKEKWGQEFICDLEMEYKDLWKSYYSTFYEI